MGLFEIVEKSASGLVAYHSLEDLSEYVRDSFLEYSQYSNGDNVETFGSVIIYSIISGLALSLFANNRGYTSRNKNRETLNKTLINYD